MYANKKKKLLRSLQYAKEKINKVCNNMFKRYEPIHASNLQLTIHTLQRAETEKFFFVANTLGYGMHKQKKGKVSNSIVRTLFQRYSRFNHLRFTKNYNNKKKKKNHTSEKKNFICLFRI